MTCKRDTSCCIFRVLSYLIIVSCATVVMTCKSKTAVQPNQTDSDAVSVTEKTNVKKTSATHPPKEMSRASLALFGDLQKTPVTSPVNITPLKNGNVVLLIFDALNAGHLSAYGYTRKTSPHIDDIAEDGLILTNHVSNSTWTRPSFTTVVTGVPKSVHGVEAAGGWRLEPEIETLAERFRQAGYNTAGFTGNPLVRKSWGFDQGYQLYEGPTTRGLKAFPNDSIWVDAAIKWLGEISEKRPFFLMMFLTSAHPPYRPPQKPRTFLSQVPKGEIIEHPYREYKKPLSKDDDMRIEAAYDDEIAYMDTQVHRLISHLKKTGRLNNTVVAMTADHGEMMGEHNCYLHAYHMWEQNTRVPFIISAPNLPLKNAMDDRPYTHVDIAPTLLDMVGIACDGKLKGRSLVKTLAAPNAFKERFRYTQVDAHGVSRQMIRHKDWKIVHHDKVAESTEEDLDRLHPSINQPNPRDLPSLAWDKERWELYDLNADAREENNLFNTPSAKPHIDELQSALDELRKGKKGSRKNKAPISPQLLEALKNAGYIR